MNERIKELARMSGFSVDETESFSEFAEKTRLDCFAELIVDACLYECEKIRQDAFVQKKSEFLTADGKMLYEGVYGGATNCGFAIQSMFKGE